MAKRLWRILSWQWDWRLLSIGNFIGVFMIGFGLMIALGGPEATQTLTMLREFFTAFHFNVRWLGVWMTVHGLAFLFRDVWHYRDVFLFTLPLSLYVFANYYVTIFHLSELSNPFLRFWLWGYVILTPYIALRVKRYHALRYLSAIHNRPERP